MWRVLLLGKTTFSLCLGYHLHINFHLVQVLHHHKSGQRKSSTVCFTIRCYDVRVVKLTFVTDIDRTEMSNSKSPEFLASTSSSHTERGGGEGGGDKTRIAQVFKDFAIQSPKILKGMTEKVKGVGGGGGEAGTAVEPDRSKCEVGFVSTL